MIPVRLKEIVTRPPRRHGLLLTLVVLACFALSPPREASAVSPAPDGGYPGNNTAEGTSALFRFTTGGSNTAVGFQSLYKNTNGKYDTAIGAKAVHDNRAAQNTATGAGAIVSSITGSYNTADGYGALGYGNR